MARLGDLSAAALPTGEQYTLRAGPYEAVVVETGGGLRTLTYDGDHLLHGYREEEVVTGGRGQLLAPWPNRIDGGRYDFGGRSHQLDLSEPTTGNAIHGLTRWESWQVHAARPPAEHRVDLRHRLHPHPGYPHVLDLVVTYELHDTDGLTVTIEARNAGGSPAPYGVGFHPYLTTGAATVDDCLLSSPARTRLPTDERGLPLGREPVEGTDDDLRSGALIGARKLDGPYADLERDADGLAWARLTDPESGRGVALWLDAAWDYLQLYTGDKLRPNPRSGLAVEPMSCPPNAFVSGDGLVVLEPGDSVQHAFGIVAIR